MQLERLQFVPRVRSDIASVDLGLRLARIWYLQLFMPCFVMMMCLSAILIFFLSPEHLIYALFFLWWLKPFAEFITLHAGSRLVFDEKPNRAQLRHLLLTRYWLDVLAHLLWRRLSFFRSFEMPVTFLEELRGQSWRNRLTVLHRRGSGVALCLTFSILLIEAFLFFGVYQLIYFLFASQLTGEVFVEVSAWFEFVVQPVDVIIYVIVISAVIPFYSMAGFSLYLNRRIELEGWDIELQFRLMEQRLAEDQTKIKALRAGRLKVIVIYFISSILSLSCVFKVEPAWANEPSAVEQNVLESSSDHLSPFVPSLHEEPSLDKAAKQLSERAKALQPVPHSDRFHSKEQIKQVLSGEAFHRVIERRGWEPKEKIDQPPELHSEGMIAFVEWLETLGFFEDDGEISTSADVLILLLKWLFITALVLPIMYLIVRYLPALKAYYLSYKGRFRPTSTPALITSMSLSKPASFLNLSGRLNELWQKGLIRSALSLWYQSSLSQIQQMDRIAFADHHTEQDCIELLHKVDSARCSEHFIRRREVAIRLIHLWSECAYAGVSPTQEQFQALLSEWSKEFR